MSSPSQGIARMTDRGRVIDSGAFQSAAVAGGPEPSRPYLGPLPQWRLEDLYEGMDAPRFAEDLRRAGDDSKSFAARYQGKLAELAGGDEAGRRLFEAVSAYEALQDLMGRIMSYASLLYAADTSDTARAKFY